MGSSPANYIDHDDLWLQECVGRMYSPARETRNESSRLDLVEELKRGDPEVDAASSLKGDL